MQVNLPANAARKAISACAVRLTDAVHPPEKQNTKEAAAEMLRARDIIMQQAQNTAALLGAVGCSDVSLRFMAPDDKACHKKRT